MKIQLKSNIAVSDNGFVFNPSTGDSFSVNPIGVKIIQWMKQVSEEEELVALITEAYETDRATVEKDLYDFFNLLVSFQVADKS
ncbi:MAG: PqqD family protein [Bacteroidia bacterium]